MIGSTTTRDVWGYSRKENNRHSLTVQYTCLISEKKIVWVPCVSKERWLSNAILLYFTLKVEDYIKSGFWEFCIWKECEQRTLNLSTRQVGWVSCRGQWVFTLERRFGSYAPHDQSGLTFFDPQLSNPWHADQNRVFVTYVEFFSLFITVIPIRFVDSGSKSVYHPSPES